jgi:methanogenic corrinoid protein MtbC1
VKDQLKEALIAGDAAAVNALTQAWADAVGADGYGADAGISVDRAKGLVG